jgi:hypothetical protein
MKNLELNAYGVMEMDVAEMQEIDGGNWAKALWTVLTWCGIAELASEVGDAFAEGVEEGYNAQQGK